MATNGTTDLWARIGRLAHGPICAFDHNFRLIAFNQAHNDEFFRVNGYYTQIGDVFPDLFVPEQAPVMRALMARALTGESFTVVEDFGNPALSRPYWEIAYEPIRDDTGAVIGAFHQARDVSVRLRAQHALAAAQAALGQSQDLERQREHLERQVAERTKELQENRARLRSIFETSFGFQSLLSKTGVLLDANATALAAIDRPLEAVVGRPFAQTPWFAGTPEAADLVAAAVPQVAEGQVVRQEILVDLPVGGWRWFDFALRPIRDDAGAVVALVAEAIETTERRRAEDALRQAQKLEAMGQLTGGVAHDFNNLLTPIIGAFDMLLRSGLGGARERRLIDGGLQAADRAKTLVQRLLAFARRQPLQSSPVDVGDLVQGIGELIVSTVGPNIRMELEPADDTPAARADPNQLEMAILNLAVNARDAMPEGGVLTLSIAGESVGPRHPAGLAPGRYVRLRVADTGVGMEAVTLARAIEPFYSTKGVGKGTGLGLSMVHGLAAQLGGGLDIRSAPGQGTTVDLWLPQSDQPAARPERGAEPATGAQAVGVALLVDDEDLVRSSTADMLAELGYRVVEAASAEEALGIVDAGDRFDLLVTDHLMPGMSGAELAGVLRRRRPGLPILLISGFAEVAEIAPDLPRLAKPFRQSDLAQSVTALAVQP